MYKDCLGVLNATVSISVFGAQYGNPNTGGYFATSTISDYPNKKWDYVSYDVSHIVTEMEAEGFDCVVDKDGYNAPRINCTHRDTQTMIDATLKKFNDKFAKAKKGYIRFGKCPKGGRSLNHRDQTFEAGVSVFEAEFVGKDYRLLSNDYLFATYLGVKDRPAYRVYGETVGTGSDGEPVLKVTRSVKL